MKNQSKPTTWKSLDEIMINSKFTDSEMKSGLILKNVSSSNGKNYIKVLMDCSMPIQKEKTSKRNHDIIHIYEIILSLGKYSAILRGELNVPDEKYCEDERRVA